MAAGVAAFTLREAFVKDALLLPHEEAPSPEKRSGAANTMNAVRELEGTAKDIVLNEVGERALPQKALLQETQQEAGGADRSLFAT